MAHPPFPPPPSPTPLPPSSTALPALPSLAHPWPLSSLVGIVMLNIWLYLWFANSACQQGFMYQPESDTLSVSVTAVISGLLLQALAAKNAGVNLLGYFYWSLLDNFGEQAHLRTSVPA